MTVRTANAGQLVANLKRFGGEDIAINDPASSSDIAETEARLGIALSEQVRLFYQTCNGFTAQQRPLQVLPLASLRMEQNGLLPFAIFDNKHRLCFDTGGVNDAGQWNIVEPARTFIVTLTMASFWTIKIFAWLRDGRRIWESDV